jgi:predicted Zn-dependent protease
MIPQEMVERALEAGRAGRAGRAARHGGCIAIADEASNANLRWAGNTLTTNGLSRSRRLTVIAIEHRADAVATGVVSRSGVRDDQISEVVRAAQQAASESSVAQDAQPLVEAPARQPFSTWDEPVAATEIGIFGGFTADLGDAFAEAAAAGRKLYGYAEHELTCTFVGTSSGMRLRHDQPSGRVELNAKSADMERSSWAGTSTRDFANVNVAGMYAQLAQRLEWAKRRIELPAARYETLLTPSAVADLLIFLYYSASAKDALDGRTVFSKPGGGTRVGERLCSLPVTLRSDPAAPGLECAPFVIAHASSRYTSVFDNGLALAPTDWISGGDLAALIQTRHSAELTGLPVTPAIDNLIFEAAPGGAAPGGAAPGGAAPGGAAPGGAAPGGAAPGGAAPGSGPAGGGPAGGASPLDHMIAHTRRGLLVNCLWYIRSVDPQTLLVTGLTRDGVYLVENGEVTGAVNNFRFNDSPVGMLDRLAEVGRTAPCLPREWGDYFPRTAAPPLRVDGFNMSSVSRAL